MATAGLGERIDNPNLRGDDGMTSELALWPTDKGYGPHPGVSLPADMHRPITSLTLAEGFEVDIDRLLPVVREHVEKRNTWHTSILPPQIKRNLQVEWEALKTHFAALDETPEGITPRLVQYETERHSAALRHFQQGLDMKHELFKTPKGAQEFQIKFRNVKENAIGTMKMTIEQAVAQAHDYWKEHNRRFGREYLDINDRIDDEIRLFGVLSTDEKGIYGLHAEVTQMAPDQVFDIAVVGADTLDFIAYANDFETEAYRRGEAPANRTLTQGGQGLTGVLPGMTIMPNDVRYSQTMRNPMDILRRIATFGAHFVLQHDDWGKPRRGIRQPEVQVIAMPEDDWVTITASDALAACLRFDNSGELSALHDDFLENLRSQAQIFGGHITDAPDPFLWKTDARSLRGVTMMTNPDAFSVVEHWGDQDLVWRSPEWDADFARKAASCMTTTPEQLRLISRLLESLKSVYHTRPSAMPQDEVDRSNAFLQLLAGLAPGPSGIVPADEEWGGPDLSDQAIRAFFGDATRRPSKPWFMGSIWAMMSFLKHGYGKLMVNTWSYGDIDYEATKVALKQLWEDNRKMFPDNVLASAAFTPYHHRVRDDDTNRMIAVFSSLLDHVKYPIFYTAAPRPARDIDLGPLATATGLGEAELDAIFEEPIPASLVPLADENNRAAVAVVSEGFEKLRPEAAGGPVGPDTTFGEFINQEFDRTPGVDARRNLLVGVIDLANLYGSDDATDFRAIPKLTAELIQTLKKTPARRGEVLGPEVRDSVNLRLTVSGKYFSSEPLDRLAIAPADPKNPTVPLSLELQRGEAGESIEIYPEARGGLQDTIFAHAGLTRVQASTVVGDRNTVTEEQQPQYIGPAGYVTGGPYQVIQQSRDREGNVTIEIKDRRFMLKRFAELKEMIMTPFERLCAFSMLLTRVHRRSLAVWLKIGCPIPMNFLGVNPFIRLETQAMLFARSGGAAGFYGFNFADTLFQLDASHKEWLLNFTMWGGGFIPAPENLFWKPDAKFAGYRSGLGRRPFREPADYDASGDTDFDFDRKPDMFVMDLPISWDREMLMKEAPTVHMFGPPDKQFFRWKYSDNNASLRMTKPSFPSWFFYNNIFNFGAINDRATFDDSSFELLRQSRWFPGVSKLRAFRLWDHVQGRYAMAYEGSGYIDRAGPPPVKAMLNGKLTFGKKRAFGDITA